MKDIELTYIIPTLLSIVSFIWILLLGKNRIRNTKIGLLKYLPIVSVLALISGVIIISNYYQDQLTIERENFLALKTQIHYNDSILLDKDLKMKTLDSLKVLDKELNRILKDISRQEKVIGERSDLKDKIEEKIRKTNEEIGSIESYNEIVDIPSSLAHGYSPTTNTSNFLFVCPSDENSEFIDLKLKFQDPQIVKKIACIYIEIDELKPNGETWLVFDQAYKPKIGVNAFKVRNYLRNKNTRMHIGYVLKSELNKKYPTYEQVDCKNH